MRFDWLIVGAGLTGSTLAERIAEVLKARVLVLDRRPHIGGNAFDFHDDHGVLVHRYGPHIFHTNSNLVWNYLSRFTKWRFYEHRVLGSVDGRMVPLPVSFKSLEILFPGPEAARFKQLLLDEYGLDSTVPVLRLQRNSDPRLRWLGSYIYRKVFEGYSLKQWGCKPDQLSPAVTARLPIVVGDDSRYFHDRYQGVPRDGYTAMISRMLGNRRIEVELGIDFREMKRSGFTGQVIFTGPLDEFFDYRFGVLPYRSLDFDFRHYRQSFFQDVAQVNYPNENKYTRISEFRWITGQQVTGTTIALEYPRAHRAGENEPFYPVHNEASRKVSRLYKAHAETVANSSILAGRLADYRYYNMDQAVARALSIFHRMTS